MVNKNPLPIARKDPSHDLVEAIAQRTAELVLERLSHQQKRLLNVPEAAEYIGRSVQGLRTLVAKKAIQKVQRDDNRVFFDREDLDRWIEMSKSA